MEPVHHWLDTQQLQGEQLVQYSALERHDHHSCIANLHLLLSYYVSVMLPLRRKCDRILTDCHLPLDNPQPALQLPNFNIFSGLQRLHDHLGIHVPDRCKEHRFRLHHCVLSVLHECLQRRLVLALCVPRNQNIFVAKCLLEFVEVNQLFGAVFIDRHSAEHFGRDSSHAVEVVNVQEVFKDRPMVDILNSSESVFYLGGGQLTLRRSHVGDSFVFEYGVLRQLHCHASYFQTLQGSPKGAVLIYVNERQRSPSEVSHLLPVSHQT